MPYVFKRAIISCPCFPDEFSFSYLLCKSASFYQRINSGNNDIKLKKTFMSVLVTKYSKKIDKRDNNNNNNTK